MPTVQADSPDHYDYVKGGQVAGFRRQALEDEVLKLESALNRTGWELIEMRDYLQTFYGTRLVMDANLSIGEVEDYLYYLKRRKKETEG